MSSTNVIIGFSDERNSSRVLNPPGGKCNDIFGTKQHDTSNYQPKQQLAHLKSTLGFGNGNGDGHHVQQTVQDNDEPSMISKETDQVKETDEVDGEAHVKDIKKELEEDNTELNNKKVLSQREKNGYGINIERIGSRNPVTGYGMDDEVKTFYTNEHNNIEEIERNLQSKLNIRAVKSEQNLQTNWHNEKEQFVKTAENNESEQEGQEGKNIESNQNEINNESDKLEQTNSISKIEQVEQTDLKESTQTEERGYGRRKFNQYNQLTSFW